MAKVKICGITNSEDATLAVEAGADAIGVIVDIESPRKVDIEKAGEILNSVPLFVSRVVVLMPKSIQDAAGIADELNPDAIQLHGNESFDFILELKNDITAKIIKVIHIDDNTKINSILQYAEVSDAILVDTKVGNLPGGTGKTHDWKNSRMVCDIIKPRHLILSGGLNPENVRDAINVVDPYAIDVSSGVELMPGKKDAGKIKEFIDAVRYR